MVQISTYIRLDQAERLKKEKNQSEVIREALDMYYDKLNPKKEMNGMKMKEVAKESLSEVKELLGLNYTPVEAWVEDWEEIDSPHGVQSLRVEWSDGNQIHSTEANQNLNEFTDLDFVE